MPRFYRELTLSSSAFEAVESRSGERGLSEQRSHLGVEVRRRAAPGTAGPSRKSCEPCEVTQSTSTGLSPGKSRNSVGELADRCRRGRASRRCCSRTSRLSATDSNGEISERDQLRLAFLVVDPALHDHDPVDLAERAGRTYVELKTTTVGAAGDVVEPHEDHQVAPLRRQLLDLADDPADGDELAVAAALELGERRVGLARPSRCAATTADAPRRRGRASPSRCRSSSFFSNSVGAEVRVVCAACRSASSPSSNRESKIEPWPASRSACCFCP